MRPPRLLMTLLFLLLTLIPALPATAAEPALTVAVTIPPQAWFVQRLAGDLAQVVVLVPPGADPHTYEPKPSQVASLSRADLWLTIGVEFEDAWKDRLTGANPKMALAAMDAGIDKRPMTEHEHHGDHDGDHDMDEHHGEDEHAEDHDHEHGEEHGEDGHHHEGLDPHVWTSPVLAKTLADNAAQALIQADPSHEVAYRANLAALQADLDALNARLAALFASLPEDKRAFLVYHPSWGYFADTYGLTQVVIESEGKEPGAKELMELIDFAKAHHVSTVFVQPQFSDKAAQVVAESIHGSVLKADPLAEDWADNMERVAEAFRQAMHKE